MSIDLKMQQILLETFKVELHELHQSMIAALLSLEKTKTKKALETVLSELFRYSHNMKGAAASASVKSVAHIAHRLEDLFTQWRKDQHFPDKDQISACLEVTDNLLLALKFFCNGETVDVETYLTPLTGHKSVFQNTEDMIKAEFIKLPLKRVEQANAKANEFITYQLKLGNWFKEINHCLNLLNALGDDNLKRSSLAKKLAVISDESGQFFGEFSRSVQSLQDDLKTMRMLPVSTVLIPLTRTVRDLALSLNKPVELTIEGGDIELDKTILDAIKDPLVHLARNAIDHGIESSVKRKKANKPVSAKLLIRISQIAGKIKLEFLDDGQGIDLEKIKNKAVNVGLYKKEEINGLEEWQILNCIFASGFSMQEKVTEISGRGVGLDIVKNNIQKINGTISVDTHLGQGTCFTLILPLTLATTRGVFFKVNEQTFMLPTFALKAAYEIKPNNLKRVDHKCVLVVNNIPVPIKVLSSLLNMKHDTSTLNNAYYYGLVIDYHAENLILLVDAIIDEHCCVVKPLPFPYNQLEHYIGVTLTGESELVLVLDPSKLMQMALSEQSTWLEKTTETSVKNKPSLKKRVLVADDSLSARTLCSSAIEAAGYEAVSAFDGKKAWSLLQTEKFDCVITDILMPEMDGFELTKLIKNDKKHDHIPVIIVSMLDSKKDKQRGLDVGANAFIVKSNFDPHGLIAVMESLI